MKIKNGWIVLFGGAGREKCIEQMVRDSANIAAIIVPKNKSLKLENSICRITNLNLKILEVTKTEIERVLTELEGHKLLSIGFPYIISPQILQKFSIALNLHPTLLPKYRGPTTAAYIIINKEKEAGSTLHFMTEQMDRGNIIAQKKIPLSEFDTIRSMQRKVYELEPQLLSENLELVNENTQGTPQQESQSSEFGKKRTPADSEIDPNLTLLQLYDYIRASDPDEFPAFFYHQGYKVCIKLWRPDKPNDEHDEL